MWTGTAFAGRPINPVVRPATGVRPMIGFRADVGLRSEIEKWARAQPDKLTLSDAVRRLVELGLKVKQPKG